MTAVVAMTVFFGAGCAMFTQDNLDAVLAVGKTLLVSEGLPAANAYIDQMVVDGKITQAQADLLKQGLLQLAAELQKEKAAAAVK